MIFVLNLYPAACVFLSLVLYLMLDGLIYILYRTLRGRDQRKKCTLNFIKYTLGQTVLYCPQRVLYCNKALLISSAIKHSLWAIKHSCPRALVQANSLQGLHQYD